MGTDKKISVCHLASGDLWAGAEVQMFTLLKALNNEPSLDLSAIILNPGKLAEQLEGIGIDVAILNEQKASFFQLRRQVKEILRGRKIDIIHTHRYKENIMASLIKKPCGINHLIQTVHGIGEPASGFAKLKTSVYGILNRSFSKYYFEKIITVSDDIKQRLLKSLPESRMITIHNSVDPNAIKPSKSPDIIRKEFDIDTQAPLIGVVGRMVPVKGFDLFIKMAQVILESRPDTRFVLVGDGPLRKSLRDLSTRLKIADKIIFPGFRDDIIDVMNAFDIFVISSYHEGVPMALLEAMSLNKAIVSTAVGGIIEVIENDLSGLLVEPNSPAALAKACLRVIEDDTLKHKLEDAASKRIEEEFSIDNLREKIVSLYKEVSEVRSDSH